MMITSIELCLKQCSMEKFEVKGWVVATECHPETGKQMIVDFTFSYLKRDAIRKLLECTDLSWDQLKRRYGFRAVRATSTIEVDPESLRKAYAVKSDDYGMLP